MVFPIQLISELDKDRQKQFVGMLLFCESISILARASVTARCIQTQENISPLLCHKDAYLCFRNGITLRTHQIRDITPKQTSHKLRTLKITLYTSPFFFFLFFLKISATEIKYPLTSSWSCVSSATITSSFKWALSLLLPFWWQKNQTWSLSAGLVLLNMTISGQHFK